MPLNNLINSSTASTSFVVSSQHYVIIVSSWFVFRDAERIATSNFPYQDLVRVPPDWFELETVVSSTLAASSD